MNPLFAVSVHDIDAGGLARSFDLTLPWLEHALADAGMRAEEAGHADVRLSKTGHDVIVRGKVTATLIIPCARCLADTTQPIEAELSLLLRPGRPEHAAGGHAGQAGSKHAGHAGSKHAGSSGHAASPGKAGGKEASKANGTSRRPRDDDEYEFTAEEADTDVYDGETVVLDDFVREALLLEAPSFPLCSEDCPGIRPSSKSTLERGEPAIDPRLSPLRALKTKLMLAAADPDAAPAASKAARPAARPKLQAHRTASGAVKRAKAKQPSKKKAK